MKKRLFPIIGIIASLFLTGLPAYAQTNATRFSPKSVLSVMERVADWQLAHSSKHKVAVQFAERMAGRQRH